MWLLLAACAPPPPPAVSLPTRGVTVEHAEAVSVDRFLAPTALGASNDLLCPWARGEAVPDASFARWTAEKRLVWRVVDVGAAGATLDGNADVAAAAAASVAAAKALAARCGAPARVEALVAVAPEVSFAEVDRVHAALAREGVGPLWMLVDDATPTAGAAGAAGATGASFSVAVTGAGATMVKSGEATVARGDGEPLGCGTLSVADDATWAEVASTMDTQRGMGRTELVVGIPRTGGVAAPVGPTAGMGAGMGAAVPLHGTVAAFALGRCDDDRCPCSGAAADGPTPGALDAASDGTKGP